MTIGTLIMQIGLKGTILIGSTSLCVLNDSILQLLMKYTLSCQITDYATVYIKNCIGLHRFDMVRDVIILTVSDARTKLSAKSTSL